MISNLRLRLQRSSSWVRAAALPATCAALFATSASCSSDSQEFPSLGNGGSSLGKGGTTGTSTGGASVGARGGSISIPIAGASGAGGATGVCKGLSCQQKSCTGASTTSISGRVFDPSGTLPLYNVMVYVPNAPLAPMTAGATCTCEMSGEPIASAITDTNGRFVLQNAPIGANIPLVVQIGKWRRTFNVPAVAECVDTAVPEPLRLPARQSEGDMPRIALTTGGADALECLLPKLGIDPAEFTNPSGSGRINYFAGEDGTNRYAASMNGGEPFSPASTLWGSVASLRAYDAVLLSCEGGTNEDQKGTQAFRAMHDYANLGGRVFASHWHQVWFVEGPDPFPNVADFVDEPDIGNLTANVVTTFPKGQALSEWLVNVQASTTPGKIDITAAQHTVLTENPMLAQRWIASNSPESVQYLSANTPLGAPAAEQCGRVVLSDIHVSGGSDQQGPMVDRSATDLRYPAGCVSTGLSPQEKVLAFMLFDITACLIPDTQIPVPPPIIPR